MNPLLQEQRFDPARRVRRALGARPAGADARPRAERARALELYAGAHPDDDEDDV